jgi:hypothetical protein
MYAAGNGLEASMKVLLQKGVDLTVQNQVSGGVREGGSAASPVLMCVCVCVCVCVWLVSVVGEYSAHGGG